MPICRQCDLEKPQEEFNRDRRWFKTDCKTCRAQHTKRRAKLHMEFAADRVITECQICGKSERKLVLDHDHSTGCYRGRLCSSCNVGLGYLGDNLAGLQKAIEYLS